MRSRRDLNRLAKALGEYILRIIRLMYGSASLMMSRSGYIIRAEASLVSKALTIPDKSG